MITPFGINRAHQLESGILHAVCACVNTQNHLNARVTREMG